MDEYRLGNEEKRQRSEDDGHLIWRGEPTNAEGRTAPSIEISSRLKRKVVGGRHPSAAADGGDGCKAPSISLNSVAARMLHIPK